MEPLRIESTVRVSQLSRLAVLAILSIVLCGAALWFWETGRLRRALSSLSWFRISEVSIQCGWPITEESVRASLPRLTGESLLTLNAQATVDLLKAQGWVDSVTLKKEYPDTLRLDVRPRSAAAIGVFKRKPYFLDGSGEKIARTSPALVRALDLPVLSFEGNADRSPWKLAPFLSSLSRLQAVLDPGYSISQVSLGRYPHFRVFLNRPRWEVLFSFENWERQFPMLLFLLHHPPRQIKEAHRLNLIFPKKAVVSTYVSQ